MSRELTEFSEQIDEQFEATDTQWQELWQAVLSLFTSAPAASGAVPVEAGADGQ